MTKRWFATELKKLFSSGVRYPLASKKFKCFIIGCIAIHLMPIGSRSIRLFLVPFFAEPRCDVRRTPKFQFPDRIFLILAAASGLKRRSLREDYSQPVGRQLRLITRLMSFTVGGSSSQLLISLCACWVAPFHLLRVCLVEQAIDSSRRQKKIVANHNEIFLDTICGVSQLIVLQGKIIMQGNFLAIAVWESKSGR